jgi:exodeoxyribonuclease V alpha subunit
MSEATGLPAQTIHRLLRLSGLEDHGAPRAPHCLDGDLLVVDEFSMVDILLLSRLVKALPEHSSLLFVGDADQLPSVGPGSVLSDLIRSGTFPVVHLTQIFRQAAQSRIVRAAHAVNQGQFPELPARHEDSDFYFIERNTPEEILRTLTDLAKNRIPRKLDCHPKRDIQVLCPMNRGLLGVREMNLRLQAVLNPEQPEKFDVEKFGSRFRLGDKVMQIVNNYDKDVFNGDIGEIVSIDPVESELTVRYETREALYDFAELDEIALAYAITIHKAQGSEFPAVIMPLAMEQYILLQRNLLYTALTRGKRLVLLVGQRKALEAAVRNDRTAGRFSGLLDRLRQPWPEGVKYE